MKEIIGGAQCEYVLSRRSDDPAVLFLHGWGGNINSFAGAYAAVCDWGRSAVNYAFPAETPSGWGIYDYAAQVSTFIRQHGIERPIIVGHSFGGRVGIILASQGLCSKLVLVDSAGMRPRRSLFRYVAVKRYKRRVKNNKPLDGYGSIDYNKTSLGMKKVFVRIVNTHLEKLLPYIICPTLIVWGKSDRETPLYMAKRLHRGIVGSRLELIDGGHYAYVDSHYGFLRLIKSFLAE